MILLDTYTLIGVYSEPERLSAAAKALIEDRQNRMFVSAISAWEICLAVRKGRLKVDPDPVTWFERAITKHAIEVADVTWRIAAASASLPPYHGDPGDRIIVATAMLLDLTLLTPDSLIHQYTEARVVW